MSRRIVCYSCLILVFFWSLPAGAQNIGFMTRGPVAQLSDAEKAELSRTLNEVLENAADDEVVSWGDKDSGTHGDIKLIDTHEDFGTECRTIRARTTADGRTGGGEYRLCRADDGSWRFAPRRRSDSN